MEKNVKNGVYIYIYVCVCVCVYTYNWDILLYKRN